MDIPEIGRFSELDLTDANVNMRILSLDKHQMLEGMVIEGITDQVFSRLEMQGMQIIPHASLIVKRRGNRKSGARRTEAAAIWIKEKSPAIAPYIAALSKKWPIIPVSYDHDKQIFLTSSKPVSCHEIPEMEHGLHEQLTAWTQQKPDYKKIQKNVRDSKRQMRSFWGYLEVTPRNLLNDVVLPRVFKNFGIQPFFDFAWDIDRVVTYQNKLWSLEIKHKFPATNRSDNSLYFGLNIGEAKLIRNLQSCGISCLHVIAIKPIWNKNRSTEYLINNLEARERCVLVALRLTPELLDRYSGSTGTSGGHTTFSGAGQLNFIKIPVSEFSLVGMLSDKADDLAGRLLDAIRDDNLPKVTDDEIREFKLPE